MLSCIIRGDKMNKKYSDNVKKFVLPEIEIVLLQTVDVVCSSGSDKPEGDNDFDIGKWS